MDTALPPGGPGNITLASRIAEQLKRDIVTGRLRSGQKLIEKDLAAAYEVSRTPLREALARLVNDGLAVSVAYRGIFVREVSRDELRAIYELRTAIEGLAAQLAADRADPATLDQLAGLLAAMDGQDTGDDASELKLLNERFHRLIAVAAGNPLLPRQMDDIWSRVSLARTSAWSATGRGETSRDEHHALYEAIRRRDAAAARSLAEAHVITAWRTLEPSLGSPTYGYAGSGANFKLG
jgi:DNA-binding GntR family transcriptional regulator